MAGVWDSKVGGESYNEKSWVSIGGGTKCISSAQDIVGEFTGP